MLSIHPHGCGRKTRLRGASSQLTPDGVSKASALGQLAVRRGDERADAMHCSALQAHELMEGCVRAVLRACGVDLPGARSPAQSWLSALSSFARTTTAAKWGELEADPR